MNNDYLDPINSEGMPQRADALFALDFLLTAKEGVRNCAFALTESATPDVRMLLRQQLDEGLALHQEISELMMHKGWFHPYEVNEQFKLDLISAKNTVQIAEMKLFPDHTSRIGMFATPNI
jgi:similar to spore coat protein